MTETNYELELIIIRNTLDRYGNASLHDCRLGIASAIDKIETVLEQLRSSPPTPAPSDLSDLLLTIEADTLRVAEATEKIAALMEQKSDE